MSDSTNYIKAIVAANVIFNIIDCKTGLERNSLINPPSSISIYKTVDIHQSIINQNLLCFAIFYDGKNSVKSCPVSYEMDCKLYSIENDVVLNLNDAKINLQYDFEKCEYTGLKYEQIIKLIKDCGWSI